MKTLVNTFFIASIMISSASFAGNSSIVSSSFNSDQEETLLDYANLKQRKRACTIENGCKKRKK